MKVEYLLKLEQQYTQQKNSVAALVIGSVIEYRNQYARCDEDLFRFATQQMSDISALIFEDTVDNKPTRTDHVELRQASNAYNQLIYVDFMLALDHFEHVGRCVHGQLPVIRLAAGEYYRNDHNKFYPKMNLVFQKAPTLREAVFNLRSFMIEKSKQFSHVFYDEDSTTASMNTASSYCAFARKEGGKYYEDNP